MESMSVEESESDVELYEFDRGERWLRGFERDDNKEKWDKKDFIKPRTGNKDNQHFTDVKLPNATVFHPKQRRKKYIILTARVHPGESCGSWMMHGFLKFITGKSPIAQDLRNRIVFKVIPMTNPDGVIIGNSRASLCGNRFFYVSFHIFRK